MTSDGTFICVSIFACAWIGADMFAFVTSVSIWGCVSCVCVCVCVWCLCVFPLVSPIVFHMALLWTMTLSLTFKVTGVLQTLYCSTPRSRWRKTRYSNVAGMQCVKTSCTTIKAQKKKHSKMLAQCLFPGNFSPLLLKHDIKNPDGIQGWVTGLVCSGAY